MHQRGLSRHTVSGSDREQSKDEIFGTFGHVPPQVLWKLEVSFNNLTVSKERPVHLSKSNSNSGITKFSTYT